MEHHRERNRVDWNHHQWKRTDDDVWRVECQHLPATRGAQKSRCHRHHEVKDANPIPEADEFITFWMVPKVGRPNQQSGQSDEKISKPGWQSETAGQTPEGVKDQENDAQNPIDLKGDELA